MKQFLTLILLLSTFVLYSQTDNRGTIKNSGITEGTLLDSVLIIDNQFNYKYVKFTSFLAKIQNNINITESQISDLSHTVDTDTHIDAAGITALGFVAGAHTVDTDTHIDAAGITALGFVAGAHTVDTDTHIDAAGITALGFVAGAHTVDTDTQLNEIQVDAFVANNGYLTSFTETDPIYSAWNKSTGISITESQISNLQSYYLASNPSGYIDNTNVAFTNVNNNFSVGQTIDGGQIGGYLPVSTTDVNLTTKTGFTSPDNTALNTPSGNVTLITAGYSSTRVTQIAASIFSEGLYWRRNSGTWGSWMPIYHSGNFVADTDYVAATGGTFTGAVNIKGNETADNVKMNFQASDASNRFTFETDLDPVSTNDLLGIRSNGTDNILVLKGNGNIGIETNNPQAQLHIDNNVNSDTAGVNHMLRLGNTVASQMFGLRKTATGSQDLALDRYYGGSWTQVLSIARSTGAATFASSVTAAGLNLKGTAGNLNFGDSNVSTQGDIEFPNISTSLGLIRFFRDTNTSGALDIYIYKGDGTNTPMIQFDAKTGDATFSGDITATDFIGSSDERLKENILPLLLEKIDSKYKSFKFKGSSQKRVGIIAQELEVNHPEFVRTDKKGMKSVSYNDLHSAEIAYLKSEVERLTKLVEKLIK